MLIEGLMTTLLATTPLVNMGASSVTLYTDAPVEKTSVTLQTDVELESYSLADGTTGSCNMSGGTAVCNDISNANGSFISFKFKKPEGKEQFVFDFTNSDPNLAINHAGPYDKEGNVINDTVKVAETPTDDAIAQKKTGLNALLMLITVALIGAVAYRGLRKSDI
jgi:hypothetical protein